MANGTCAITFLQLSCFACYLEFNDRSPRTIGGYITIQRIFLFCIVTFSFITFIVLQALILGEALFLVYNLHGFATPSPPPENQTMSFTFTSSSATTSDSHPRSVELTPIATSNSNESLVSSSTDLVQLEAASFPVTS